ncbi:MAG: hypothetical protein GY810_32365 [Aureispira sp.]|nr:hypothetical protein [Aureispira sp.]
MGKLQNLKKELFRIKQAIKKESKRSEDMEIREILNYYAEESNSTTNFDPNTAKYRKYYVGYHSCANDNGWVAVGTHVKIHGIIMCEYHAAQALVRNLNSGSNMELTADGRLR